MSKVWKFFEVHKEDKNKAVCNLCETIVSRGGFGKSASTSPLIIHLKRHHDDEFKKNFTTKEKDSSASTSTCSVQTRQPTLTEFQSLHKVWDINDKRAERIHYKIAEMICIDNQPFSLVENTGFKRLLNTIVPQYKTPSRKYFSENIIPDIYNRVRQKISNALSEATSISFTSDIWTCSNTNESFISITGHWISEMWEKRNFILCCDKFPGSHTALAIADKITTIINSWAIEKQKIHLLLRDSGANMVKGCKDAEINSEGCFIHKLQLIINDSINSQRTVSDMITCARRIATHFNHSSLACSKLSEIQQELNMDQKKIIQDVQTRWNSTFYMLERLLHLKRSVTIYLTENSVINNLTNNQWDLLQSVLELLRPFEEITKLMSSTDSVISEVIPTIAVLKRYLLSSKIEQLYGVGTMKESLITGMNKRFSDVESKDCFTISTILDPRYKVYFFSSKTIVEDIKNKLVRKITEINKSNTDESESEIQVDDGNNVVISEDEDEQPLAAIQKRARIKYKKTDSSANSPFTLWNCYDDFVPPSTSASSTSGSKANILHQLEVFYGMPIIDKKSDPIEWWRRHRGTFPVGMTLWNRICFFRNRFYLEQAGTGIGR